MFKDWLPGEGWTLLCFFLSNACFLQLFTLGRTHITALTGHTGHLGIWLQCHLEAISWGGA